MSYLNKKPKARTPETRQRNKRRKALLYAALDFLEAPRDINAERYGSTSVLYTQMLVGVLIRTLSGYMVLPKSKRRAAALGIAFNGTVPAHEKKLQRKHLSSSARARLADRDRRDDKRLRGEPTPAERARQKLERLTRRGNWDGGALV